MLPRERGEVRDGHPVDPRSAVVGPHAFPRSGEVFRFKDSLDHVSLSRGSMLSAAGALEFVSPPGVIDWLVSGGVDPLLIGSALHRVSPPVSQFERASSSPRLVPSTTMASADFPPPEGGR